MMSSRILLLPGCQLITFDSTDTTSKRTLFLQKLQGVKSKLAPSFFMKDLEMEEDIDCD
jgi:hypothetical protein